MEKSKAWQPLLDRTLFRFIITWHQLFRCAIKGFSIVLILVFKFRTEVNLDNSLPI